MRSPGDRRRALRAGRRHHAVLGRACSDAGRARQHGKKAEQSAQEIDEVFTTWPTLAAEAWPGLRTHLDIGLRPERLDLDEMAEVRAATAEIDARAETVGAAATSKIGPLFDSTTVQRDQARSVIPLLAVQLAVLGIVVLAFVCAAATEQRRPEIALARLRGHGTFGAALLLLRELGVLVLVGSVLGAALGWLVAMGAGSAVAATGRRCRGPVAGRRGRPRLAGRRPARDPRRRPLLPSVSR